MWGPLARFRGIAAKLSDTLMWLKLGDIVGRRLPRSAISPLSVVGGVAWYAVSSARRGIVRENQRLVHVGLTSKWDCERAVVAAYVSYVRYYIEVFCLGPEMMDRLAVSTVVENQEAFEAAMAKGQGAVIVSAHVGNWDYAASWFAAQGCPVAAVVEALEPVHVAEWFAKKRKRLGIETIPLGAATTAKVLKRLGEGWAVALVADRDITATGQEFPFFGRQARISLGPALLALRNNSPILPCVCYLEPKGAHRIVFSEMIEPSRGDGETMRERVRITTSEIVEIFEGMISRAPVQWHVFVPFEGLSS